MTLQPRQAEAAAVRTLLWLVENFPDMHDTCYVFILRSLNLLPSLQMRMLRIRFLHQLIQTPKTIVFTIQLKSSTYRTVTGKASHVFEDQTFSKLPFVCPDDDVIWKPSILKKNIKKENHSFYLQRSSSWCSHSLSHWCELMYDNISVQLIPPFFLNNQTFILLEVAVGCPDQAQAA